MICFPYMIHYVCKVAGTMSFYKCNGTTNLRSLLAFYHKVGTINNLRLNIPFVHYNCNGDICLANDMGGSKEKTFARSSPFALSLRSITNSRLSLDPFFDPPSIGTTSQPCIPLKCLARWYHKSPRFL